MEDFWPTIFTTRTLRPAWILVVTVSCWICCAAVLSDDCNRRVVAVLEAIAVIVAAGS